VRAILDTSVVIATDLAPLEGELAISAVTLAELSLRGSRSQAANVRAERLRRLLALQRRFDALHLDEAVAASYGQVAAALATWRRQPRARSIDLLIAATAHAHSAQLYTRNADDFDGLVHVVTV
jgi:toxin FitB